jgi:hypothetical protein
MKTEKCLYLHYQNQILPQDAYLEIDGERQTLEFGVKESIGNCCSVDVFFNGKTTIKFL